MNVKKGSCLCGAVQYQIDGDIGDIVHCHCETCRKAHGSAFSSVASVQDKHFHLTGESELSHFESSPGKTRYFCRNCGTQVYAKRQGTEHIILRLGSLESDIRSQELSHIWVSQQASWYEIGGELPKYDKYD